MATWWWLSFAGDEGFRGGCLVKGGDMAEAVSSASRLGINPGGEVRGIPVPEYAIPANHPRERLLQRHEILDATEWPDDDETGDTVLIQLG